MSIDHKQIAAWLARIVSPGSSVELRILFDGRSPIIRHYRADQLDDLAADALHHGDDARGCYVTLNPLPEEFRGRAAKDVDIVRRRWLLVDCDPVRPADVSASDAEKLAAEEKCFAVATFLESLDWPAPVIADSGNGSHLLYPIDLPADDGGLVARVLKALAGMFSDAAVSIDTKVANASRIVKLYGTVSRKGPDTPERPHRASSVVSMPDELKPVPVELLEALARSGESPAAPASGGVALTWDEAEADPLPGDRIDRASKYLSKIPSAISGECGSNKLLRACSILVNDYGLPDEEAFGLLMTEYNPRCLPPWEEGDIQRKLSEARKNVPARASKVERSKSLTALPSLASGMAGQPPYVGFPTDALPEVLRQFVELGAAALCCDPSYLALPMLAVCGAALGNAVRLRLKPGWLAPPILWTAIVGESGSSKTPAFRAVLDPVRRRQHLMIRAGADAEAEHAKELLFYKRNLADWERKRQSSDEPPNPPASRSWND